MTGLVTADLGLERYRQPVPSVDRDDRHREIDQLAFRETFASTQVQIVGHSSMADLRDGVRPLKRRSFAGGVERRVALGRARRAS
jgi:hypothetical protein